MLKHISISNYILIEELELDFSEGFSVITGETGAGKSILLGALSLILGKRADTDVLLDKERKCIIEGVFDMNGLGLEAYFEENDLDFEQDTVLRREINMHGRSRAFINDSPVNLPLLKTLGERLVDIHSQHQTLLLNESGFQMGVLDNYAGNTGLLEKYRTSYVKFRQLRSDLETLLQKEEGMRADEEYLRFQYDEIEAASLRSSEMDDLEGEIKLLSNAEEIKAILYSLSRTLSLDDNNVLDRLRHAMAELRRISDYRDDIGSYRERLDSAIIEMKDIAEGLERLEEGVHYDPKRLEEATDRFDHIQSLLQKHKVMDIAALQQLQKELRERLDGIRSLDEDIDRLRKQTRNAEQETEKLAENLTEMRAKAIPDAEKEITASLTKLGMNEGVLKINLDTVDAFTLSGKDRVTFTFSANRGSSPAAISKIASGGELSRLMLAIKSMITAKSLLPTIILDEIDMGVSGDIAAKVGAMLEGMSLNLQLIVITHLPQISAKAGTHYKVYKKTTGNRTVTRVKCLTDGERIEEIAGMLSDESVSTAAKQTAKELLGK
ncbi:MAG: DNA repair protein RecN [Bacteroidales bacterium]|jgi:DNA repair protein RecN (Recombination protein N)|nr:DNA repair protein RecN [Bacteroidales bacterium]